MGVRSMSLGDALRASVLTGVLLISTAPAISADTINPLAGNPEAVSAGGALFARMNCDGCHGIGAPGWVGPSLVDGRWRYGGDDAALFQSIRDGRPAGMPAYSVRLAESGIWEIISYLRSLPEPRDIPTLHWPPER